MRQHPTPPPRSTAIESTTLNAAPTPAGSAAGGMARRAPRSPGAPRRSPSAPPPHCGGQGVRWIGRGGRAMLGPLNHGHEQPVPLCCARVGLSRPVIPEPVSGPRKSCCHSCFRQIGCYLERHWQEHCAREWASGLGLVRRDRWTGHNTRRKSQ